MATYIEYKMENGSTVLVEAESSMGGVVKASRGGVDVVQAGKNFTDALASIRGSLKALVAELNALEVEGAEVKFGIKAVGEAGNFAVGKVGGEMNYEVTLQWKKPEEKSKRKTRK
jgi:Trypsin-co-occurring domain 1